MFAAALSQALWRSTRLRLAGRGGVSGRTPRGAVEATAPLGGLEFEKEGGGWLGGGPGGWETLLAEKEPSTTVVTFFARKISALH